MRRFLLFITSVMGLASLLLYQNCGKHNLSFSAATVAEKFGEIDCSNFSVNGSNDVCLNSKNGLIGHLYYLLDKTDGKTIAPYLYDKNDQALAFNGSVLNSVNVVIDRGYTSNTYILMSQVEVPALPFTSGFQLDDGSYLKDTSGKILIEGFALDLKGGLQLAPGMSGGQYEVAIISDDGSLLDVDLNNDGNLQTIIQNDGYHPPKMGCSTQSITLNSSSKVPIRLRYYQGPRTTIALTLVMRKLADGQMPGQDPKCGATDDGTFFWFGSSTTSQGYAPNFTTSPFGNLLSRGWFVPQKEMFALPDSL